MVLILESRSHLDLGDLTNLLAAELGVMTVRLERAIRSLDGVERVHVNRWGDGAAHMHLWFLARPTGHLQLRGSFLSLWDDILEPIAEPLWRENLAHVAAWLADFGGRAVAEPPRIVWHAPSSFVEVAAIERSAIDQSAIDQSASALAVDDGDRDSDAVDDGSIAGAAVTDGPTDSGTAVGDATAEPTNGDATAEPNDSDGVEKAQPEPAVPVARSSRSAPDRERGAVAREPAAADREPVPDREPAAYGPDGLGGDGWMLSSEDVEDSDILAR